MSVFVASAPGSPLSGVLMKGSCALAPGERECTRSWTQTALASTSRRTVAWRMCASIAERLAGGCERPDLARLQAGGPMLGHGKNGLSFPNPYREGRRGLSMRATLSLCTATLIALATARCGSINATPVPPGTDGGTGGGGQPDAGGGGGGQPDAGGGGGGGQPDAGGGGGGGQPDAGGGGGDGGRQPDAGGGGGVGQDECAGLG